MEESQQITERRLQSWCYYNDLLSDLASRGHLRLPIIPASCKHNAHMYYILCKSATERDNILQCLKKNGIDGIFHYIPLHSSPAGTQFGRANGELVNTNICSSSLIRLPLWCGIKTKTQEYIVEKLREYFSTL